ncbi:MAG: ABC transporter ATP-binding protein [SAR202 cluster bacterium]|nr:ABC transporter ATP-binding protein [SAR202 cluster bacterium]
MLDQPSHTPFTGPLLQVRDLTLHYRTRQGDVRAVDGVTFSLGRGQVLGLVGESGCGKTSLGMGLLKLLPSNARLVRGEIIFDGQDLAPLNDAQMRRYRWRRIAMIFQAAMNALDPVYRVGEQILEAMEAHAWPGIEDGPAGQKRRQAREKVKELFRLVGLDPELMDRYPHELSGGMRQRAVIAMSLACRPDLVIADEPTTALDVIVQERILRELKSIQKELGLSLLYITHDVAVVAEVADQVGVMYAGQLVELGDTPQVFHQPMHPYTAGLLASFPSIRGEKRPLAALPGEPPSLVAPPSGCRFHPRCPRATKECRQEVPPVVGQGNAWAACWHPLGAAQP